MNHSEMFSMFQMFLSKYPYPPEKEALQTEQAMDHNRNPYNESHKPKIRSVEEIYLDLAHDFACNCMHRLYGAPFLGWYQETQFKIAPH